MKLLRLVTLVTLVTLALIMGLVSCSWLVPSPVIAPVPSAPTITSAAIKPTATTTSVTFTWTSVSSITAYHLFRAKDCVTYVQWASINRAVTTFTYSQPNGTMCYYVTAYNNTESVASNIVQVSTP